MLYRCSAPLQTAVTAVPTLPLLLVRRSNNNDTIISQQEDENIAARRAFNEAIQSGSPSNVATEVAVALLPHSTCWQYCS